MMKVRAPDISSPTSLTYRFGFLQHPHADSEPAFRICTLHGGGYMARYSTHSCQLICPVENATSRPCHLPYERVQNQAHRSRK